MILRIEIPYDGLLKENYYESSSVGAGRKDYSCHYCGGNIPKGTSSTVHKFYPEFDGYRTHTKCNDKFIKSLR